MTSPAQKTTRDLRWHNRSDLLTRLYLGECASRNELARASGLSQATVSNVVSDLINDGLIVENGSQSSAGGRPRSLLRPGPDIGHVIGVDIGETRIRVALFDWTLRLVAEEVRPVLADRLEPHAVADQVLSEITAVTAKAGIAPDSLLGVGVGVPGAVRGDRTTPGGPVIHAPTLGWSGVPLAAMLGAHLGFVPDIDNGAMALGQAESWRGAARGAERAVTLLLGIGAGGALSMGTGPRGGSRSFTLEWGHTAVDLGGPTCRCGARGCLETYIGAEAILSHYLAAPGSQPIPGDSVEQRLAELLRRATDDREPTATAALDRAATYLGVGISNLINLVAPDRVILSGWAGAMLCSALLPAIRATVQRHALPSLRDTTRIEPGELGPEATALGAATLPVARLLADGGRQVV